MGEAVRDLHDIFELILVLHLFFLVATHATKAYLLMYVPLNMSDIDSCPGMHSCYLNFTLLQVEEAVAVLQAHQAKESATKKE